MVIDFPLSENARIFVDIAKREMHITKDGRGVIVLSKPEIDQLKIFLEILGDM